MIKLKGSFAAIITPFKDGKVDENALRNIVKFHLDKGTSGILPCGSTGEAAVLSEEEYIKVIKTAADAAGGKMPVICGSGGNCTAKSVDIIKKVSALNIDAILAIVPYYNKPTQEGMIEHFSGICENTDKPIVVYNIPSRTGVNMLPATLKTLREKFPQIIGIKEASGNLDQVSEIANIMDEDFVIMSGDDSLTLPMMSIGAKGVISVVANIMPAETEAMCRLFLEGKTGEAAKIHHRLYPLIKALFVETNPIPVKYAAHLMGFCEPSLRLPLMTLSEKYRGKLKEAMKNAGIKIR